MIRSTHMFRSKKKTILQQFKYKGFLVRIVNTHNFRPFNYEWEMIPLSNLAKQICQGKEILYDPTSWLSAKWAKRVAKADIDMYRRNFNYHLS